MWKDRVIALAQCYRQKQVQSRVTTGSAMFEIVATALTQFPSVVRLLLMERPSMVLLDVAIICREKQEERRTRTCIYLRPLLFVLSEFLVIDLDLF